jgi:hypothetical protein
MEAQGFGGPSGTPNTAERVTDPGEGPSGILSHFGSTDPNHDESSSDSDSESPRYPLQTLKDFRDFLEHLGNEEFFNQTVIQSGSSLSINIVNIFFLRLPSWQQLFRLVTWIRFLE